MRIEQGMPSGSAAGDILRYSFLRVFANDGTIDSNELRFMEKLALKDGSVDDAERRVLATIFARVTEERTDPAVWQEIHDFKSRHGVP